MSKKGSQPEVQKRSADDAAKPSFSPVLYNFRARPLQRPATRNKTFALQQPFATLFDNLIAVLWSMYGKGSKVQIGINQLQWAMEFMRCMKVDYGYPESIEKITNELEDQLIGLYAKVGRKLQELQEKRDQELNKKDAEDKSSKISGIETPFLDTTTSYNENDILGKLLELKVAIDPATGKAKHLKELNSLGRRKPKPECPEPNPPKDYMIGALQKILKKTTEVDTKTGVEELLKELSEHGPPSKKTV